MTTEIPLDNPRRHTIVLAATAKGACLCRGIVRRQLADWGVDSSFGEPFHSALLIVAELAANAITHGRVPGRGFELHISLTTTVRRGATLRIEVSDCRGDRLPVLPSTRVTDGQSGRGLVLIDALADRWGTALRDPSAKTVWAELDFADARCPADAR
ncbi:ATP-binding protein [Kitasatospora purpeofusca]|uniref:ATP-binding protein n=1 Tax=Kitasatospora purpeofusca TaxID=67352 RepID=UPI00225AF76D|nr:ATP-binding protein [Kitasatospora purpeofusca]MCX4758366.1 ATP-binding protein [Kitasatospora purpeofusca]WSR31180.1 ATP-binding protein [Kitasatospora purpeofusca]WSR39215.1 ATP-binding protein [Kitasatospora purpeofusca]